MAGATDPDSGPEEGRRRAGSRPAATAPDAELLRACVDAVPGAWDAFVARFGGLFAHVAACTARQRGAELATADRDDVVAEVLLEVVRDDAAVLRRFSGQSSLATYLTVIARRVTVRYLVARRGARIAPAGGPEATHDPRSATHDREEIEALLGGLDEDEARLVRLHHLEARSYGEISRLTGLPLGSIGPALSRARDKMRSAAAQLPPR
ncbi:MAG: sigma-70 family RNA polymerase sigma factor [Planctomycetaceae bacterium]